MYDLKFNHQLIHNNNCQSIIREYNLKKRNIFDFLKKDLSSSKSLLSKLIEKSLIINKEIVLNKTKLDFFKNKELKEENNTDLDINTDIVKNDDPIFIFKQSNNKLFNTELFNNTRNKLEFITKSELKQLMLKDKSNKLNQFIQLKMKNKPFKLIIYKLKKEINILNTNYENSKLEIVKLRKEKIEYYKELDIQIYNNINETNSECDLSNLGKSFFFDNLEIYELINNCHQIIDKIAFKKRDLISIYKKQEFYNSQHFTNMLSSIKSLNNENKCKTVSKSKSTSIIINNEQKYNIFIKKLNNIFSNQIKSTLNISKKSHKEIKEQIKFLNSKIILINNVLNNKTVNTILRNINKFYQAKLNNVILEEYKNKYGKDIF